MAHVATQHAARVMFLIVFFIFRILPVVVKQKTTKFLVVGKFEKSYRLMTSWFLVRDLLYNHDNPTCSASGAMAFAIVFLRCKHLHLTYKGFSKSRTQYPMDSKAIIQSIWRKIKGNFYCVVFFPLLFIKGIYNHWAINKIRDAQIMNLFIKRLN